MLFLLCKYVSSYDEKSIKYFPFFRTMGTWLIYFNASNLKNFVLLYMISIHFSHSLRSSNYQCLYFKVLQYWWWASLFLCMSNGFYTTVPYQRCPVAQVWDPYAPHTDSHYTHHTASPRYHSMLSIKITLGLGRGRGVGEGGFLLS